MKCTCPTCEEDAKFHLSWMRCRRCVKEEHLCETHAREVLTTGIQPLPDFSDVWRSQYGARQFDIFMLVISEMHDQQVVYFWEVGGSRYIPILTGIFEALALSRRMKGESYPRPLTHDALAAAIRLLGGDVLDVMVHRLDVATYHAEARIERRGENLSLDLRPSDAFMLALLFECPIYFTEEVLAQLDRNMNVQ